MRRALTGIVLLVLAACSMPETRTYSLNMGDSASLAQPINVPVSLSVSVESPRYLDQPYIVSRTSPYQLDLSRYARWESSPADMTRDAFRDGFGPFVSAIRLSRIRLSGHHTLQVTLRRFELFRSPEGPRAHLAMDIQAFSPDGVELYQRSIEELAPIPAGDDYISLAKGLSDMLAASVARIRTDLLPLLK